MKDNRITTISQIRELVNLAGSLGAESIVRKDNADEIYKWMEGILTRIKYSTLRKKDKGTVRKFFLLYSVYSESHIDHLIFEFKDRHKIARKKRTQPKFSVKYTTGDIKLLAEVANAYSHQNGKALKEVCKDMFVAYNDLRFVRLQDISVSWIYELKNKEIYKTTALEYSKTKSVSVPIGERKKPYPEGKPGFLRVDSVHQGDLDGEKGVYHINLVDEVTQYEIVVCVEGISEFFLEKALEEALMQFPFKIINFHSDNGGEYINKVVARLLDKMFINQTKSRARKTTDNSLVEGKNGAVIRKHMGRIHIPRSNAEMINEFYKNFFNPFLNLHRFCIFPEEKIGEKGKIVKVYKECKTPLQKLLSLDKIEKYLREGFTRESLVAEAKKQSHFASAEEMQKEKNKLFNSFKK